MGEVKWIKLATDIFDNRKIKQIEKMPEGDALIVVWLKLLILAGNTNDGGLVYFTRDIPYTEQLLSNEFNRPLPIVQLALGTFQRFGMIDIVDDVIHISNWEKYQNIEGMEKIREQNRIRQKNWYDRQKALQAPNGEPNVRTNVILTRPNATDKEEELEVDIEGDTSYLQKEDEEEEYILSSKRAVIEKAWKKAFGRKVTPAIADRIAKVLTVNTITDETLEDCITRTARREANDPASYLETLIMEEAQRDRIRG